MSAWAVILLAAVLHGGAASDEPSIEVAVDVAQVELGAAFEVVVIRRWRGRSDRVATFDPATLAPLDAEVVSTARRVDDGVVEETVRCLARAWTLGDVEIPALELRVGATTAAEEVVLSESFVLPVHGVLTEVDSLEPELPGPLLEVPPSRGRRFTILVIAILGALAGTWLVTGIFRRRRVAARVVVASPPHEVVRGRLDALEAAMESGENPTDVLAGIAAAMRGYAEAGLGIEGAAAMTSVELDARLLRDPRIDRGSAAAAAAVLTAADGAKFGRGAPTRRELETAIASVAALVAVSAPEVEEDVA